MHALLPVVSLAGIAAVLPVTNEFDPFPELKTVIDTTDLFTDATAATRYTTKHLLPQANQSMFAVQAPTNMPFLADAIVHSRMAVFWMDDMCTDKKQHQALEEFVERSG